MVNALVVALTPGIVLAPDLESGFIKLLIYLILVIVFGLINAWIGQLVLFVTGLNDLSQ